MGGAPGEKQGPGTQTWFWEHRRGFGNTDEVLGTQMRFWEHRHGFGNTDLVFGNTSMVFGNTDVVLGIQTWFGEYRPGLGNKDLFFGNTDVVLVPTAAVTPAQALARSLQHFALLFNLFKGKMEKQNTCFSHREAIKKNRTIIMRLNTIKFESMSLF